MQAPSPETAAVVLAAHLQLRRRLKPRAELLGARLERLSFLQLFYEHCVFARRALSAA